MRDGDKGLDKGKDLQLEPVRVTAMTFVKGLASSVIGGVLGYLSALQAVTVDPGAVVISSALLGGVAYLVGYCHGWDKGVKEGPGLGYGRTISEEEWREEQAKEREHRGFTK